MCMTLCFLAPARAEIITVTSDSGGTGGPDCTLRDAITAANTDTPTGGCPAGSGADTIELPVGATIMLTEVDSDTEGPNGLPSITSEIIINGNVTTIQRQTGGGTPDFRLFHIAAEGNLMLDHLTASSGSAQMGPFPWNEGGGIMNHGELTLTDSNVSDNTAVGGGGGIRNYGELTLTKSNVSDNTTSSYNGGGIRNTGAVTLTDSNVSGNTADFYGGGIWSRDGGTVTLTNSIVSGNSAGKGGGIHGIDSTVSIAYSIVSGNSADHDGGGIVSAGLDGTLTLTNSTVSGNSSGAIGGGIWLAPFSGDVTLTNSMVNNNTANWGGGLYSRSAGTVTVTNCTFDGNSSDSTGGGILNRSVMTLTNCTVSGNSANSSLFGGGGIMNRPGGIMTLTDSVVIGNSAGKGGGIHNRLQGTLTLIGSIVSENTAGYGGGIYNNDDGMVSLTNSTVSGNFAGSDGGGIWSRNALTLTNSTVSGNAGSGVFNVAPGMATLTNCIVANNTDTDCENDGGTVTDAGYNIVEDGTCISDPTSFGGDPMLGPLQDNGGPTPTHALLEGSPAIDTIPVGDCVVDTDQRGVLRPQGDGCDIGSYEVELTDPCADDDGDGLVTICHIPPGHSGNAHTITVSVRALPAHLAHGDQCGPCEVELSAQRGGGKNLGSNNGARSFGRTSVAPRP